MISFRLSRPGILFKQNWILFLLWLFLLVFPKGGIKISNVPITWGYLFIGISSFLLAIRSIQTCSSLRLYAYLASIPFQIIAVPALLFRTGEFGYVISFVTSFYFFPLFFFLLASRPIDSLDMERFLKFFQLGVFIIAIYGIFVFSFKLMTGKFIEIPFLTTNFHDLDVLETKCNQRGAFLFKLVSTYNNGNIYGVCLLMLLPLYDYREKSLWRKSIVKLSLILTLSRTVWVGFVFYEIIRTLFVDRKSKTTVIKILLVFVGFFVFLYLFQLSTNLGFRFLFDTTLGGRRSNFAVFENLSLFPSSFHAIGEMVYLSILGQFGMGGFLCFLLVMLAPLFLFFTRTTKKPDQKMYHSILCGIINYLFVCTSDGAMLLIPTMAFYWFFCSLLLRNPRQKTWSLS